MSTVDSPVSLFQTRSPRYLHVPTAATYSSDIARSYISFAECQAIYFEMVNLCEVVILFLSL